MKRIVTLLVGFPLALVLVAIAVTNRQTVPMILDPFRPENPALVLNFPFYAYLFGSLVIGVLLGGAATWFGQSRWRRAARAHGERAARFEAEADRLTRERDKSVAARKGLALTAT